jgi:hypothetical protein
MILYTKIPPATCHWLKLFSPSGSIRAPGDTELHQQLLGIAP